MKLTGKTIDRFLATPDPDIATVVVYGPDEGLVRERVDRLIALIADDPKDPFRVAELTGSAIEGDPARLADEADQLPMTGGRRVVKLREAGDGVAKALMSWLDDGKANGRSGGFVVIEAGDLGPRSGLRKLAETHKRAASMPCYRDEAAGVQKLARDRFRQDSLEITPDAMQWLATHLGSDRAITMAELDKLALYKLGDPAGGRIELADVLAVVGDSAELALDDLVYAIGDGELPALERALGRSFAEGAQPVTVLRACGRHFLKLQLARGLAREHGIDGALRQIRPPIFFKYLPRFKGQVGLWSDSMIADALGRIVECERQCKRAVLPAQTVCHHALIEIAERARGERKRAG